MKIGVPKEIKIQEGRVAMTPEAAKLLIEKGHQVFVEFDAGLDSGFSNEGYQSNGVTLVTAQEAWNVDLVVKVKEPMQSEYQYFDKQMLFTFFHLSGVDSALTEALLNSKVTAIAYETLENEEGRLPILASMSAIAGNMATLIGAYYLAKPHLGKGVQLGTVMGKQYGTVLVVGDGIVGQHAAQAACGLGAKVTVAGIDTAWMQWLKVSMLPEVDFIVSTQETLEKQVAQSDLVVGAVLCRGAKAPKIITEAMVKNMSKGSVIVDVSIDQGGCMETSQPTTHSEPVFVKHGVTHYCVTNMPGAYPVTSTLALVDATLPYIKSLVETGLQNLIRNDKGFSKAILVYQGQLTSEQVANDLGLQSRFKHLHQLI
ncbi:alanine dehydrogenase [Methylicorpusculum oleiharenae]|uniref:alanine dehydrogenase n=1 Tax=Methylicorpusculum oleiharenae TaxID=1338687 RepID=UPI0013571F1A|nr:alanine dehydrogenase [Methylicorpusculum oleiharenae]MCD2449007.1 alanine dehydrogenase [Methylicorpusculum oleiharenae]